MVTAKQSLPRMNAVMFILLISMGPIALRGHLEFNNVHCLVRNRKFMEYEYCYLKSINRTYKYLSLKTKIHHLPVDNCVTRFQFRNRENRRLMYNLDFKVDACKFMRDRQNVVANWVFQTFESYSNINHTCPYDQDLVLNKLPVQYVNRVLQSIVPDGRYFANLTFVVSGVPWTEVLVYFTKS